MPRLVMVPGGAITSKVRWQAEFKRRSRSQEPPILYSGMVARFAQEPPGRGGGARCPLIWVWAMEALGHAVVALRSQ